MVLGWLKNIISARKDKETGTKCKYFTEYTLSQLLHSRTIKREHLKLKYTQYVARHAKQCRYWE